MIAARWALALASMAVLAFAQPAAAQKYPERSVRLVVAFPTGASQILGLLVSEKLRDAWKQPVVPDFKPGAAGNVAAEIVAKAPADGYTLLLTSPSIAISPNLFKKLGYDPVRDLIPVAALAAVPNIMIVHPSVPAKTLQELAKLARANPGKLNYASSGVGGSNHLASELFSSLAKVRMTHVPYKGVAIAMTAMLSGEVDVVVSTVPATIPHITAGRLRALAVLAPERVAALPKIPTSAEAGMPGLVVITWYGLFAPAGVKPDVVERVNADVVKFMGAPDTKAQLAKVELDAKTGTPAEFAKFVREETERWGRVIRDANIRTEQ
jgi:tripartite-type tricarboxylate transporter receptor subunit TctC